VLDSKFLADKNEQVCRISSLGPSGILRKPDHPTNNMTSISYCQHSAQLLAKLEIKRGSGEQARYETNAPCEKPRHSSLLF